MSGIELSESRHRWIPASLPKKRLSRVLSIGARVADASHSDDLLSPSRVLSSIEDIWRCHRTMEDVPGKLVQRHNTIY